MKTYKLRLVRHIKKYHPYSVSNALWALGYRRKNPARIRTNIEAMVCGIPRCDLIKILDYLQADFNHRILTHPVKRGWKI